MHCTQLRSCCSLDFVDVFDDDFELEPPRLATPDDDAPDDPPQEASNTEHAIATATTSAPRPRLTSLMFMSVRASSCRFAIATLRPRPVDGREHHDARW
jgi:hypothetical protein